MPQRLKQLDFRVTLPNGQPMDVRRFVDPIDGQITGISKIVNGRTVEKLNIQDFQNYRFTDRGAYAYDATSNTYKPAGNIIGDTAPQPPIQPVDYSIILPDGKTTTNVRQFQFSDGDHTYTLGYSQTANGKSAPVNIDQLAPDYQFRSSGAWHGAPDGSFQFRGTILNANTPNPAVTTQAAAAQSTTNPRATVKVTVSESTTPVQPASGPVPDWAAQAQARYHFVELRDGTQVQVAMTPSGETLGFRTATGQALDRSNSIYQTAQVRDGIAYDKNNQPIGKFTGYSISEQGDIPSKSYANEAFYKAPTLGNGGPQLAGIPYEINGKNYTMFETPPRADGRFSRFIVDDATGKQIQPPYEFGADGKVYELQGGRPTEVGRSLKSSENGASTGGPGTDPGAPQKPGLLGGIKQHPGRFAGALGLGLFTAALGAIPAIQNGASFKDVFVNSIPGVVAMGVALKQSLDMNLALSFGISLGAVLLLLAILSNVIKVPKKDLDLSKEDPDDVTGGSQTAQTPPTPPATGTWETIVPPGTALPILAAVSALAIGINFGDQKGTAPISVTLPAITPQLQRATGNSLSAGLIGRSFYKRGDIDEVVFVTQDIHRGANGETETSHKIHEKVLNTGGYEINPNDPKMPMTSFFLVDPITRKIYPRGAGSTQLNTQTSLTRLASSIEVLPHSRVAAVRIAAPQGRTRE